MDARIALLREPLEDAVVKDILRRPAVQRVKAAQAQAALRALVGCVSVPGRAGEDEDAVGVSRRLAVLWCGGGGVGVRERLWWEWDWV